MMHTHMRVCACMRAHTHTHTHTHVPETILGAVDSLMNNADKTPCSPETLALKKG